MKYVATIVTEYMCIKRLNSKICIIISNMCIQP